MLTSDMFGFICVFFFAGKKNPQCVYNLLFQSVDCVCLCVLSYSLVQWALPSASVSPLLPPPTASSAAQLQSVTREKKKSQSKRALLTS